MRPEDPSHSSVPPHDAPALSRDAAANLIRNQLNALYDGGDSSMQPAKTAEPAPQKVAAATQQAVDPEHWKQYHSAWQNYYQKYYEQYYTGHMQRVLSEHQSKTTPGGAQVQATSTPAKATSPQGSASAKRQQEVAELRSQLLGKVQTSAKKVRKSRHFIPIAAAMVVVIVFAFLQYNSLLIGTVQAYISPGAIDPQNIVVDPTADTKVGPEPKLIIPKINVDVPVVFGVGSDHNSQMAAMEKGVAHFSIPGASSIPGQVGNTALAGHSSNDIFGGGDYKFIFAQLEKLQTGDMIYVNYQSIRYTYTVTKKDVVSPNDGQKLIYATDKPMLTLITCTPLGTALNRLLVTAEQISPDPSKATAAPDANSGESAGMPGNSRSAFERLIFGE